QPVDEEVAARYRELVDRRAGHEPVQYILGWEEFRGLRLTVTPDVLIPRPETEGLVERALELLGGLDHAVVADVGTGSGAIACALAAARPDLELLAVDQSLGALAVASDNVRTLGLASRVRLLAGDLFGPPAPAQGFSAIGARRELRGVERYIEGCWAEGKSVVPLTGVATQRLSC